MKLPSGMYPLDRLDLNLCDDRQNRAMKRPVRPKSSTKPLALAPR